MGKYGRGRITDAQGNEYEFEPDWVKKVAWTDASGEQHEVEGHGRYGRGRQEGDPGPAETEAHGAFFYVSDGQGNIFQVEPSQITNLVWVDDDGEEHDVEAHGKYGRV
jgi:hypothetical protein